MKKDIHELIAEALKKQSEQEPLARKLQIDEKIRETIESLKEFNRDELKRIETKKHIFWRMLAITASGLLFVLLIASPVEIGHLVAEKVRENVVDPDVKQSLDRIVQENASGYINTELGPFRKNVDELRAQLLGMKSTIAEAETVSAKASEVTATLQRQSAGVNDQLKNVYSTLNLTGLIVRADNDDRKAFDQLLQIAKSNSPFSPLAGEVIIGIIGKTELQVTSEFPWQRVGTPDPKTLTFDAIKQVYAQQRRPDFKRGLLQYIWNDQKFSKSDKLDFLISVIKEDGSISTVTTASGIVDGESKIMHNVIDAEAYVDWWAKNKGLYESKANLEGASTNAAPAAH